MQLHRRPFALPMAAAASAEHLPCVNADDIDTNFTNATLFRRAIFARYNNDTEAVYNHYVKQVVLPHVYSCLSVSTGLGQTERYEKAILKFFFGTETFCAQYGVDCEKNCSHEEVDVCYNPYHVKAVGPRKIQRMISNSDGLEVTFRIDNSEDRDRTFTVSLKQALNDYKEAQKKTSTVTLQQELERSEGEEKSKRKRYEDEMDDFLEGDETSMDAYIRKGFQQELKRRKGEPLTFEGLEKVVDGAVRKELSEIVRKMGKKMVDEEIEKQGFRKLNIDYGMNVEDRDRSVILGEFKDRFFEFFFRTANQNVAASEQRLEELLTKNSVPTNVSRELVKEFEILIRRDPWEPRSGFWLLLKKFLKNSNTTCPLFEEIYNLYGPHSDFSTKMQSIFSHHTYGEPPMFFSFCVERTTSEISCVMVTKLASGPAGRLVQSDDGQFTYSGSSTDAASAPSSELPSGEVLQQQILGTMSRCRSGEPSYDVKIMHTLHETVEFFYAEDDNKQFLGYMLQNYLRINGGKHVQQITFDSDQLEIIEKLSQSLRPELSGTMSRETCLDFAKEVCDRSSCAALQQKYNFYVYNEPNFLTKYMTYKDRKVFERDRAGLGLASQSP